MDKYFVVFVLIVLASVLLGILLATVLKAVLAKEICTKNVPTPNPQVVKNATGERCGGFVGLPCQDGYYCQTPSGCFDCYGICVPK